MAKPNECRIIGGKFRGRKIPVLDLPGLRPTPDRVRETLFNWLAPTIHGAVCLDCFAGSGALSFEALSRGAKEVIAVDQSPQVIHQLQNLSGTFNSTNLRCIRRTLPDDLPIEPESLDVIFLDPPFHQDMVSVLTAWLEKSGWLKPESLIYIEAEKALQPLPIPKPWRIDKAKTAGQVGYYLVRLCESL